MGFTTELAERKCIDEILELRNTSIQKFKEALEILESIETRCKSLGDYIYPFSSTEIRNLEIFRKELDKRLWEHCFDKLGVFTLMDSRNIEILRKELKEQTPEFTEENIYATTEKMYENRTEYFCRSIILTFRGLSKDHKTNTNEKFKIPDKCIIKRFVECRYDKGLRINYYNKNRFSDIDRAFKVLDKKPFEQRKAVCEANDKLYNSDTYENDYLVLKGYHNGNAHIKFKRIDLLDKMNQIIAEHYGNSLK